MVAFISMSFALVFAGFADRAVRSTLVYRTLLIWPYAVAPVVAGALWIFMFDPTLGIVTYFLELIGIWNYKLNGNQAMVLVILVAAWKQIAYNFLFLGWDTCYPRSMIEAAAIGSGPKGDSAQLFFLSFLQSHFSS